MPPQILSTPKPLAISMQEFHFSFPKLGSHPADKHFKLNLKRKVKRQKLL
jgi:hypothetical protein